MHDKKVLYLSSLLVFQGLIIVVFFSASYGNAVFMGIPSNTFSNIAYIFISLFVLTLLSTMGVMFRWRKKHFEQLPPIRKTNLSEVVLEEDLESKNKKEIMAALKDQGYTRQQISEFIHGWEKHEEKAEHWSH